MHCEDKQLVIEGLGLSRHPAGKKPAIFLSQGMSLLGGDLRTGLGSCISLFAECNSFVCASLLVILIHKQY